MSSTELRERIAAMRADGRAVGELLAAEASQMSPEELFDVTGELQGVLNATEGAQLVATAHAAAHETRLTDRGPVQVHHGLGFVDAMAPSEVSLSTGTGQWRRGDGSVTWTSPTGRQRTTLPDHAVWPPLPHPPPPAVTATPTQPRKPASAPPF